MSELPWFSNGNTAIRLGSPGTEAGPTAFRQGRSVTTIASSTTTTMLALSRDVVRARKGGAGADPLPSRIHFSSLTRSWTACHRSSGSFSRDCRIERSRAGGDIGASSVMGMGSSLRMDPMRLALLVPRNGLFPVAISYRITPNAKMSVRASAFRPSSCSGAR